MQITNAMKMVSAAKLKKAQDTITAMRPYANKLSEKLIQNLSATTAAEANPYGVVRPVQSVLIIPLRPTEDCVGIQF